MDRNKVERLVISARNRLVDVILSKNKQEELTKINEWLNEALDELQKSDWIAVEDELPPYGEEVLVYSKGRQFLPHTAMRMKTNDYHFDNNGFLKAFHVTHWCKIDKLEV